MGMKRKYVKSVDRVVLGWRKQGMIYIAIMKDE